MQKRILAIYYSQTGQLTDIINNFCTPFISHNYKIEKIEVGLKTPYPFPWTKNEFLSVMPDCVFGKTCDILPFHTEYDQYDLIIWGFQPWYLHPSIPTNSLLQNQKFISLLKSSPTITICDARNMWVHAFLLVKQHLQKHHIQHVGHIAKVDRHSNIISLITIMHWMQVGKKDKYLGIFPLPGVSQKDIDQTKLLGQVALKHLEDQRLDNLQDALYQMGGMVLKNNLVFMELKAKRLFNIWANFITKRKNKIFWLRVYDIYLTVTLFTFAPLIYMVNLIFFYPFNKKRIENKLSKIKKLNNNNS